MNTEDFTDDVESAPDDFRRVEPLSLVEELKRDRTYVGRFIFGLYLFWVLICQFQVVITCLISLTVGTIAGLLFAETSDNTVQAFMILWIAAFGTVCGLCLLYGMIWCCGSVLDKKTNRYVVSDVSPFRFLYVLMLFIFLFMSIFALLQVRHECYDEDGNYRKPLMVEDEQFIIYCDIPSFL